MVKVVANGIEVLADKNYDEVKAGGDSASVLQARFADVVLAPSSLCGLGWADNERLLTCRLRAELTDSILVSRTAAQIAREVKGKGPSLDELCQQLSVVPGGVRVFCAQCDQPLTATDRLRRFHVLPCDDWQELCSSAMCLDFFCHGAGACSGTTTAAASDGKPSSASLFGDQTDDVCLVADSYLQLPAVSLLNALSNTETLAISCETCNTELGRLLSGNASGSCQLYHSKTKLKMNKGSSESEASHTELPKDEQQDTTFSVLEQRFFNLDRYFAWLLLSHCESQTSLKFVLRSFDKSSHLLIWLLDSYSVVVRGRLKLAPPIVVAAEGVSNGSDAKDNEHEHDWGSFSVVKMLYKVFDKTSAAEDPRANGADSSVTTIEQPVGACLDLTHILLDSTYSLPPACRSVGQFYVGFLKLDNKFE